MRRTSCCVRWHDGRGTVSRQNIASATAWEPVVGYSRAVRVGERVFVSGTTATGANGEIVGSGDPGAQMRQCLANIETALRAAGAAMPDVVRTRIYVVDMAHWETVAAEHRRVFATIRPAPAMVEVARLIDPGLLVEIEADAVIGCRRTG